MQEDTTQPKRRFEIELSETITHKVYLWARSAREARLAAEDRLHYLFQFAERDGSTRHVSAAYDVSENPFLADATAYLPDADRWTADPEAEEEA